MTTHWACAAGGFLAGAASVAGAAAWVYSRRRRRYGRFLSFIAHEINTPLTSMNMTVLNFARGIFGPLSKDQEDWMRLLVEQSVRMSALVGDFRDLIHIEFHRDLRLQLETLDLAEIVKGAAEGMEGSIARSGAKLSLEIPPGLLVRADEDRLRRVAGAVLSHAKKFRTAGPIAVSARMRDGGGVELAVAYRGPALTRKQAVEMLDLFYPVDRNQSAVLTCVGLGLGACRALVRGGGGEMDFEVGLDGASRILVRLPPGVGAPEGAPGGR